MNRQDYLKIPLCICLLAVSVLKAKAQSESAEFDSAQSRILQVGRDDPFAALPTIKKSAPQMVVPSQIVEQEILPELYLESITLKFLNVRNLEGIIKNMSSRYGSIAADDGTNSLIICDTKEDITKIIDQIRKIDRRPKQIMVEVVILDVQLKDDTEIGINWDILSDKMYDIGYKQNFTTSRLGSTIESDTTRGNATAFNTTGLGGDFSVISGNIRNVIHMIQQKRDAEVIASPRAMMVSGQSASIQAVEEIPYEKQSETSEGGSMTSTEFKNVGVNLMVTAIITDGNDIFLTVDTQQNVKTGESINGVPVVDTRQANTALLLQDGQIVVIGGLRRREETIEVDQIPFLGDLPIIGELFKSTNIVINNSELIVLLSPHIYKGEAVSEGVIDKYNEIKSRPMLSLPDESRGKNQSEQIDK
jgi:type II secretory pathway component GspD/PulD (secretin)